MSVHVFGVLIASLLTSAGLVVVFGDLVELSHV
jgi:hypothetical protein